MKRLLPGLVLGSVLAVALATPVSAFTYLTWPGTPFATEQPTNYECVSASTVNWINEIRNTDLEAANPNVVDDWYVEGRGYNKYQQTANLYGIDPRGWAMLMYNHTPQFYTYNDYIYSSQTTANLEIVYGIRVTGDPVGVLVAKGNHALLAEGFYSTADPLNGGSWSLTGFFVVDPWYPGDGNSAHNYFYGAWYGLQPESYISVSEWNADYFKRYLNQYHVDGTNSTTTIWGPNAAGDRFYTLVLRKDSPAESPKNPWNAAPPYAESYVSGGSSLAANLYSPEAAYRSVEDAVISGISANGLADDNKLGIKYANVTTGESIFVDAVDTETTDYYLVTVNNRSGSPVGLAMVTVKADGFHLAAITPTDAGFVLPTAEHAGRALGIPRANAHAVWAQSADSPTPFAPIWVGRDTAGREHTMTMSGHRDEVPVPATGVQ